MERTGVLLEALLPSTDHPDRRDVTSHLIGTVLAIGLGGYADARR